MVKKAIQIGLSILPKRYRTADWLLVTIKKYLDPKTKKLKEKTKVIGGSQLKKHLDGTARTLNKEKGVTAKVIKNPRKIDRGEYDDIVEKTLGSGAREQLTGVKKPGPRYTSSGEMMKATAMARGAKP